MAYSSLRSDRRPLSLWTRIVTLISVVLVAGILITGALSLSLLYRTLLGSLDNELRSGMEQMQTVALAQVGAEEDPSPDSPTPVYFIVEFRAPDGTTLQRTTSYHGLSSDSDSVRFPDWDAAAIREQAGRPFTLIDGDSTRWRVLATPSRDIEGGSVFVALPLDGVDRTMNQMALVIVLVGTFVVLIGMGAGGYMTHRALEPLRDVESTAAKIAGGDLTMRVPLTDTSLEVNALAISLNEMLVSLEQSFVAVADSEAKATRSEARMRRFVGDASHELRTPLAAIRGFGELYRMGALRTEEDVASALRRIEDEARRMGSLVENLLRLARLDEAPDIALQPIDITDAVFDIAQDLRALDPTRRVMVVNLNGTPMTVEPHVPIGVLGDESGLRQVIVNLVGNANRHTPKGSPVEIAVGPCAARTVAIEVRDHGEGISAADREKVFERFYRTDESRQRSTTKGGGAGLGLSIAASIIQQHKGRVTVLETPGGGATFRVELQAADLSGADIVAPDQVREIEQQEG